MSLQANELRLGNLVSISDVFHKDDVVEVGVTEIYSATDGFQYFGIPLTPEILEKAGFELLPRSVFVYRILIKDVEISVSIELNFAYIDTVWGQASIKHPIFKYLHQVQNLVHALTGTELTIKL